MRRVLAFLPLLTACPDTATYLESGTAGAHRDSVYYGETSPTLYTSLTSMQQDAVVAVCGRISAFCHCSGAVISPHVVLTAAHCIDTPERTFTANDLAIHVGADAAAPSDVINVSVVDYGDWRADSGDDVGILVLSSAASSVTPLPIKRGGVGAIAGNDAQVVGYGMTETAPDNDVRYWTTMPVEGVWGWDIQVNGHGSTGVGHGDSGSPLLYDFGAGPQVAGNASTSEEGWVWRAHYVSVAAHEAGIQSYVDAYDEPACLDACTVVECGTSGGCECGDCTRGYECVGNSCHQIPPGTGGVCLTLAPNGRECDAPSDCLPGEDCVEYDAQYSECGDGCGPVACSSSDPTSSCLSLEVGPGDYLSLCFENPPPACSQEGQACTTPDARAGYCLDFGAGLGCHALCRPVETCPTGTGCVPLTAPSCASICSGVQCGNVSGCNCGTCAAGSTCQGNQCVGSCQPSCVRTECGPDGCGGTCGACGAFATCSATGLCVGCACDDDYYCSAGCDCDAECPCSCDDTYACDDDCDCDPDCAGAGNCLCTEGSTSGIAALGALALGLARRRRRLA